MRIHCKFSSGPFNISTGKSKKTKQKKNKQNYHENVSQFTIQIHIKRPKKLKNGRLTKHNYYNGPDQSSLQCVHFTGIFRNSACLIC